jgi:hypothetical protein
MSRFRRCVTTVVVGVTAALAAGPGTAGAASQHWFHAHVDAYSQTNNCGVAEWHSQIGVCKGSSQNGNAGSTEGFNGAVFVNWCPHDSTFCRHGIGQSHAVMPAGYDRWMVLCQWHGNGECFNWLLGAVKMPNGPFAVVAGHVNGHAVRPTSTDAGRVEHQGGPLFLYVGFHSHINNGGGKPGSFGYVFGFRGWIDW